MPLIRLGSDALGGGQLVPQQLTTSVIPFKFGTTRLGTSDSKFRGTIQLGKSTLGGGGFAPPDPRNAYIFWSAGTNVSILPEVNGVVEHLTSHMGVYTAILPKLGKSFTFGYGGVVRYSGQTDSPQFDGAVDVAFTAYPGTIDNTWFRWNLLATLTATTPTTPSTAVQKISTRFAPTAYLNGSNRFSRLYLDVAPYNGRRLTVVSSGYDIVQNRFVSAGVMAQWTYHVPVVAQYGKIDVIDVFTPITGLSSFSGTLTGTTPSGTVTFVSSQLSPSSYHIRPAIYLISGSILAADMNMDGATAVAISGVQIAQSNVTTDGSTSVSIQGDQSFATNLYIDGATDVAIAGSQIFNQGINGDGATDVRFTDTAYLEYGWQADGVTDVAITPEQIHYAEILMDGVTDVSVEGEPFIEMDGVTDVAIDAAQIYTSDVALMMDGATNVSILANHSIAGALTIDGITDVTFANTIAILNGLINADGATNWTLDTIADYFIHIDADGTTDVEISAASLSGSQIVITLVGDMFISSSIILQSGVSADGATDVSFSGVLQAAGQLSMDGVTDVDITPKRIANVFINMDGSTDVHFEVAQDVMGEVIFDQIQQDLTAIGSFIYGDGSITPTVTSTLSANGTNFVLGPDYIWGIIANETGFGAPDYVPVFSGTLSSGGKDSIGGLANNLGHMKYKYAFGFTRDMGVLYNKPVVDNSREEWVRINFFVDDDIDFSQMADTIGFTASSITAIAGNGIVGRNKEEYVTYSLLTNVRTTQNTMEILSGGDPNTNITQINYELLFIPPSYSRTTQIVEEVLYLANLAAIQQVAIESISGDGDYSGFVQQVAVEMMHSIKATTRVTQTTTENLVGPGDPLATVTQINTEILTREQTVFYSTGNIQQVAVETVLNNNPFALVQQSALETCHNGDPKARIIQSALETVHNNDRNGRINQVGMEAVANSTTYAGVVAQVAIEMLVKPQFDGTVGSLVNNPRFHI